MPRFNNGNPGTGQGRGLGTGRANGCGQGLGRNRGRVQRQGQVPGLQQASLPDPGFFRRNCLGIAEQPAASDLPQIGRFESVIDDLQRQIDELKRQLAK